MRSKCPECGFSIDLPAADDEASVLCPACQSELTPQMLRAAAEAINQEPNSDEIPAAEELAEQDEASRTATRDEVSEELVTDFLDTPADVPDAEALDSGDGDGKDDELDLQFDDLDLDQINLDELSDTPDDAPTTPSEQMASEWEPAAAELQPSPTDDAWQDETDREFTPPDEEPQQVPPEAPARKESAGVFEFDELPLEEGDDRPLAAADDHGLEVQEAIEAGVEGIAAPAAGESQGSAAPEAEPFAFESQGTERLTTAPVVPKKRNLARDAVKIALGAVAALVILQAVAWWALGMDPLGLANLLPSSVAFLAPSSVRDRAGQPLALRIPATPQLDQTSDTIQESPALDESASDTADSAPPGVLDPVADPDATGGAAVDLASAGDRDTAGTGSLSPATDTPDVTPPSASEEPSPFEAAAGEAAAGDTTDLTGGFVESAEPPVDGPSIESPADDLNERLGESSRDNLSPVTASAPPNEVEGADEEGLNEMFGPPVDADPGFAAQTPRGLDVYSRNDLAATVAAAKRAQAQLREARTTQSPKVRQVARQFYIAFCDLAERATLVRPTGSEAVRAESRRLMEELAQDRAQCMFVANCARGWLSKSELSDERVGVFLAGTVLSSNRQADVTEVRVRLLDKRQTEVTIVRRVDPTRRTDAELSEGDQALMMGVQVVNPVANLPGYAGRGDRVVYVADQVVLVP